MGWLTSGAIISEADNLASFVHRSARALGVAPPEGKGGFSETFLIAAWVGAHGLEADPEWVRLLSAHPLLREERHDLWCRACNTAPLPLWNSDPAGAATWKRIADAARALEGAPFAEGASGTNEAVAAVIAAKTKA